MGMNRFQKLFIDDLKRSVTMWLNDQKECISRLLSLSEDTQGTVPAYKVAEYTQRIERAVGKLADSVFDFQVAMIHEEEIDFGSPDFDGYDLVEGKGPNCTTCNYCVKAMVLDPFTKERVEKCYCSMDLFSRDVKENNVCTSYDPQEDQNGKI